MIPLSEGSAIDIGVKRATAEAAGLNRDAHGIEVVLIKDVKRISPELERKALGDVERFLQAHVKITVARLTETVDARSIPGIEIEAVGRFERVFVEERFRYVNVVHRL